MHAGAYATLEDAIRHHVRPAESLKEYGGSHLTGAHQTASWWTRTPEDMIAAIDPELAGCYDLTEDDVVARLSSSGLRIARTMHNLVPTSVPSGLPVE